MLIDAGPAHAYSQIAERLESLEPPAVDLLVLTHVDSDHIEGTILLTNDRHLDLAIGEVWFNGEPHLTDELGGVQGEILSAIIAERGLPWNAAFGDTAIRSDLSDSLTVIELPGALRVTVLAPDRTAMRRLRDEWLDACEAADLTSGSVRQALDRLRSRPALLPRDSFLGAVDTGDIGALARSSPRVDRSVPNASSIVLLLEYGHVRLLLAGDSTPRVLVPAVTRLLLERGLETLPVDAFKLPHHGSAANVTTDLVRLVPARQYLFSTDGSIFGHPDDPAVARILEYGQHGCELVFNYDTPRTRQWENPSLQEAYGYDVRYPAGDDIGVALEWQVRLP